MRAATISMMGVSTTNATPATMTSINSFPRSAKRRRPRTIFERVATRIRPRPYNRFPHCSPCEPAVRAPTLFTHNSLLVIKKSLQLTTGKCEVVRCCAPDTGSLRLRSFGQCPRFSRMPRGRLSQSCSTIPTRHQSSRVKVFAVVGYLKISHDAGAIEEPFVTLLLEAHARPPKRIR